MTGPIKPAQHDAETADDQDAVEETMRLAGLEPREDSGVTHDDGSCFDDGSGYS